MVYWLSRAASWLAGRVPRPWRLRIAGPLTVLIYYFWVSKRRVTIANMATILGTSERDPRARQLARDSWLKYGRYVSDFFYLPNATRDELLARMHDVTPPPGAFALIDEGLARGKGVILVSAHFGAWDVAGVMVASHVPIHLIVEPFDDPRMDKLVQEQRGGLGMGIIPLDKMRQLFRVLQQNGVIAVAIDRPVGPSEGVPVTFFGKRCYVPGGIAQIALKTGAAILPGYARYDDKYSETYYVGAMPLIIPESTGDREADVIRLTQRMYDALEAVMREYPDQWAMFRRFWPKDDKPPAPVPAAVADALPASADTRSEARG